MNNNSKFKIIKKIEQAEIGTESAMLDIEQGSYFIQNEVGSIIWKQVVEGQCIDSIINSLLLDFNVSTEACTKSVYDYIESLIVEKFIEEV